MLRILYISIAALLTGLIVGLNIQATPSVGVESHDAIQPTIARPEVTSEQFQSMINRIESLENSLKSEIAKREALGKEFFIVKQKLDQNSLTNDSNQLQVAQAPELSSENSLATESFANESSPAQTTQQVLLSMGISQTTLDNIKQREEQRELDQLYLRNQATREGWIGTTRYTEESTKLSRQSNFYRDELGDEKYDRYLFESGQFNRVTVQSVISASPAANAGIEAGDIIFSYDNERLFTWMELTTLTSQGTLGETIAIRVQRNGEPLEVYVPRGPLGIRLSGTRVNPE